jgi:hypothetical protein
VQAYHLPRIPGGYEAAKESVLVPYGNIVNIGTGEEAMIIDYVLPDNIKIYRATDSLLLSEEFGMRTETGHMPGMQLVWYDPNAALQYSEADADNGCIKDNHYSKANCAQSVPKDKSNFDYDDASKEVILLNPNHPDFKL